MSGRRAVELVPDPARAGRWAFVSLLAFVLAGWVTVVALGGPFAWLLLGVSGWTTWVLGSQALVPAACTLVVDEAGVRGWHLGRSVELAFHDATGVTLRTTAGEPVLAIGRPDGRARAVVLPLGCDLDALREVLATVGPGVAGRETAGA